MSARRPVLTAHSLGFAVVDGAMVLVAPGESWRLDAMEEPTKTRNCRLYTMTRVEDGFVAGFSGDVFRRCFEGEHLQGSIGQSDP